MLGKGEEGSILFLSSRYVDMSVTRTMLTTWMDTALNTLMTMPCSQDVRMWFLVDELGALHRLSALEKGLQTARNYGGAIVLGIHAFGKLKDTYGQNVAETLASLARTKLLLATDDRPTATFESDCIGHRQFREMEEGYSYGYDNVRDAVTLTSRRNLEPLVLPDDIMNLANLTGYLRFPGGFPSAAVSLGIVNYPRRAEGFIPRPPENSDEVEYTGADAGGAGEGARSGDGGAGHAADQSGAPERTVATAATVTNRPANDVTENDPAALVDRFFSKSGLNPQPPRDASASSVVARNEEGEDASNVVATSRQTVQGEAVSKTGNGETGRLTIRLDRHVDLTIREAQQNFTPDPHHQHHQPQRGAPPLIDDDLGIGD